MSRKLAKQTVLVFIITVLIIMPGTVFSESMIQTTQRIIVIDPGHGGLYNGLVTSGGMEEKNIALKLAQKTAQKLENRYNVILTRTKDINISPQERMFIANNSSADFFLSIHLNNSKEPSCFFYYFDPPESGDGKTTGPDNTWKSQPLFHQPESKQAINSFLSIFSAHKKTDRFFSNGAPIILLEGSTMPAVLIEALSISLLPNSPDEINDILDEYAVLIEKGIDRFFEKK